MSAAPAMRLALLLCLVPAAQAGGGAEAEGAHGEEKHDTSMETIVAASCLLSMVAAIQLMFYLTNSKFKLVRLMTWKLTSATVSIFVAILIWSIVNNLHKIYLAPYIGFLSVPFVPCNMFILIWGLCQAGLFYAKHNPIHTAAVAMLGGHVTGFCGIYVFGHLQDEEWFMQTIPHELLPGLIFAAVVAILAEVSYLVRQRIVELDGEVDKLEEVWLEKCREYEDEVIAMVMGKLNALVIRFIIVGHFVGSHTTMDNPEGSDKMILSGVAFVVLTILATAVRGRLRKLHAGGPKLERVIGVTQHIMGMTSAWILVFGFKWFIVSRLRDTLGVMMSMMVGVMVVTALAAFFVIALNLVVKYCDVHKKVLRVLISSVGLLVGLSWEKTFDHGIHAIAYSGNFGDKEWMAIKLSLVLIVVCWPSWQWYILPKGEPKLALLMAPPSDSSDEDVEALMESGSDGSGSEDNPHHGGHHGAKALSGSHSARSTTALVSAGN